MEKIAEGSPLSRIPIQNYISSISAKRSVKRIIAKTNLKQFRKGTGEKQETIG